MGRRALLVIAAMLVAAFGVGMIYFYVSQADVRAREGLATVEVWVAKSDLSKGTQAITLTPGSTVERIPVTQKFAGASYVLDQDLSAFKGKILLERVAKGQPLQRTMFGDQATVTNQSIAVGKVAISIPLSDPARVAGLLLPDSKVTIFKTIGKSPDSTTDVLLYDVRVLSANGFSSADSVSGNGSTSTVPKALVTLELTTRQAGLVVHAENGTDVELWLGLENTDKPQERLGAAVTDTDLKAKAP
jgi:pilus assembly protein CpaB